MISVVTQAELFSLAKMNNWGKDRLDRLEELLNELVIVDITSNARPILERYAAIDVASHLMNQNMKKNDLWIAASAAETGAILLT